MKMKTKQHSKESRCCGVHQTFSCLSDRRKQIQYCLLMQSKQNLTSIVVFIKPKEDKRQNQNSETKKGVSNDYLKHIIDTKNIPLSRQKLLIELIERKVDHRTLLKFQSHLCDCFPDQDIPLEDWRKLSPKYFK